MERIMVKQSTPPPQNRPPPPVPGYPRPVDWNAPVTRGEFQQGIGALEKNLRQDINALDKRVGQDINALDKRLTVVETKNSFVLSQGVTLAQRLGLRPLGSLMRSYPQLASGQDRLRR